MSKIPFDFTCKKIKFTKKDKFIYLLSRIKAKMNTLNKKS